MSEELDNDGTLKSHEFGPPKSLQKMENADILWKMITKRFPNAAPLLCEMEAVIDRADDLLRQLRRPYGRSVEDTEVFEDVAIMTNTVETQISKSSVTTVDTDFDSILSNQPSSLIGQKSNNSTDDLKEEENGKESNKNVDECKSEESVQEQIESTSNSKKNFEKIQENEKKHSSGDWNENINVENHSSTINDTEEMEIYKNVEITDIYERDKIITFSGDENINKRTPWDILEEYANQCNINIDYHCEKNKCNRFVISGKLSEFSATGCGDTEDLAKNNIAKKILQNIADHQMNDKKMKQLLELSREQILEIINFENDDTNETPLRKVYMLCIKKGGSAPRYITGREYKHQGVKCVAKCMALNHVVEGEGVSRHNAKKAAAEQFYQKYSDNEI
ncbi:uncharacterized protein LOC118442546 isoform X2 [Vespa mandarinia]|uniref:uncharacterized protein LOC118442546 isoform X2 n=1 Tax=Vespa mandarinia TaxID=7446 RepID=UPI00161E7545|nr:uncharacterized protein LOC118442546 isoform X2 [Vespa mandarinia]